MDLTGSIVRHLRANGFPDAASGSLPAYPDRAQCVLAGDLRPPGDPTGSRFQVILRGSRNRDDARWDAQRLTALLASIRGPTEPDGARILEIRAETGVACLGADAAGRLRYSVHFRALLWA